jgi:glycosyltransferase involved in cell wall biosynthesis
MTPELSISIITACRNSETYIEKTLLSVIGQQYHNFQYIVVDGASSDSTLNIVNQYCNDIDIIISEPDAGQYYGIQKGAGFADSEIMAWLNSDDIYCPWAFSVVNDIFQKFPEVKWIIGRPGYMNAEGQCIKISGNTGTAYPQDYIRNGWFRSSLAGYLQQESMFWRKSLWDQVGGLNLNYSYAADFDLWTQFAKHTELYSVGVPLALFRKLPGQQRSSAGKDQYEREVEEICKKLKNPPLIWKNLAKINEPFCQLIRFLIWKRCRVIVYSSQKLTWVCMEMHRPLSRASFSEALLEYRLRH